MQLDNNPTSQQEYNVLHWTFSILKLAMQTL